MCKQIHILILPVLVKKEPNSRLSRLTLAVETISVQKENMFRSKNNKCLEVKTINAQIF
jgi:hypothetical protein